MPHGPEFLVQALLNGRAEVYGISVALAGFVDDVEEVGLHLFIEIHADEAWFVLARVGIGVATTDGVHGGGGSGVEVKVNRGEPIMRAFIGGIGGMTLI